MPPTKPVTLLATQLVLTFQQAGFDCWNSGWGMKNQFKQIYYFIKIKKHFAFEKQKL